MPPHNSLLDKIWHSVVNNLGAKLVSVVVAGVLWSVVISSRNTEETKEVPVELITPADLVPSNEIPQSVAFRLSGPRAFLRTILDRRDDPIRVNLSGSRAGLVTYHFSPDNIRLPIGVKVLSANPSSIFIKLEYLKRRDVPVKVVIRGTPPEGYKVARVEVKPEMIRIRGAESRVDSITEISTAPIDVSSIKEPTEREASLDLGRYNVQLDGAVPKVSLDVEPISANYKIKNVDIRVLSSYKSKLDEKTVNVLVRAATKDLKSLDRSHVYAVIDLTGKPKGKYQTAVKVVLPDGVSLVKAQPENVNVTLY